MNNVIKFGSKLPPEINFSLLSSCSIPIHIFSAGQDQWADTCDTDYLYKQISQVWSLNTADLTRTYSDSQYERNLHHFPNASHLSFFIGKDMSYIQEVDTILERCGKEWLIEGKEPEIDNDEKKDENSEAVAIGDEDTTEGSTKTIVNIAEASSSSQPSAEISTNLK